MTSILRKNVSLNWFDLLVICSCILFFIGGAAINVHNFWQFNLGYYDFGIFDRAIWSVAHLQPPVIDHFIVPGKLNFADHFNPSIYIFAPIYWFTDKSEYILIMPSLFVAISGFFLYLIGKKILKDKISAFVILVCYFLYQGL